MKTKFVLHGGFKKQKGSIQKDNYFFQEMLKDTPNEVKILLVYFAERENMISLRIKQDKEQLNKNKEVKNLHFRVASEERFIEDCAWADVIYLHGGQTIRLIKILSKYKDLKKVFTNKIIAGDSAGAKSLGKLFFSNSTKEISEGLGILPFKIVAHYVEYMSSPLAEIRPDIETLFLHEYETRVFSF